MIRSLLLFLFICLGLSARAQQPLTVDMSRLEGIDIAPNNVFSFRVFNPGAAVANAVVKGSVRYKQQSDLRFSFEFRTSLPSGFTDFRNTAPQGLVWNFPNAALKELFQNYQRMPQGSYEYCVSVTTVPALAEAAAPVPAEGCVYQDVQDLFLINLVSPDDKIKFQDYHPLLSWTVNFVFPSALKYRLRIADQKAGESSTYAISRNNPVFQQSDLSGLALVYPATARNLETGKTYAWTVDAYYEGILLGGSEVWSFTLIGDTLLPDPIVVNDNYFDYKSHTGEVSLRHKGVLKLKLLNYSQGNTLTLALKTGDTSFKTLATVPLKDGENLLDLPLLQYGFPAGKSRELILYESDGKRYFLPVSIAPKL